MKKLVILFATAFIGLAMAPGANAKSKESFSSERTVKSTDDNGTDYKESVKSESKVEDDGDASATVKTETTTDPKGLGNKTTVKTKHSKKKVEGKTETSYKKDINGNTVEEEKTVTE